MRIDELTPVSNIKKTFSNTDSHPFMIYDNDVNKVVRYLQKYGFKKIGSGGYATIFENPKFNYVLKIFKGDSCYKDYVSYCLKNSNNQYLPKFKGKVIKFPNE